VEIRRGQVSAPLLLVIYTRIVYRPVIRIIFHVSANAFRKTSNGLRLILKSCP
jgi:hypothetical protein